MQVLCSTGTFSRFPDITDHQSILEYGPLLAVDGLEVMFFPGWTGEIEQIAAQLRASGLHIPAIHAEKGIGSALISTQAEERAQGWRWLQASCRLAQALQAKLLVLHLWGHPDSDDRFADNLAVLPDCLAMAERHDLTLAVETIPSGAAIHLAMCAAQSSKTTAAASRWTPSSWPCINSSKRR